MAKDKGVPVIKLYLDKEQAGMDHTTSSRI